MQSLNPSRWQLLPRWTLYLITLIAWITPTSWATQSPLSAQTVSRTVAEVQPKIIKITGSGGFQGLEPYQSGFLVSNDGYVLTVWSYVLDDDFVTVTLDDGQRFDGKLIGYDPRIEIALLKIDATDLPYFSLAQSVDSKPGTSIVAFSNLYGIATGNDPVSVQRGIIAAHTKLDARRGVFATGYRDHVYLLDAITNNPGAAGGAVTNSNGQLTGLIGKELRDQRTNQWVNFAIPIKNLANSVEQIRNGKMVIQSAAGDRLPTEPITLRLLGLVLVPDIVSKTPPFIDRVIARSPADRKGIKPDDLIIEINGHLTPSIQELHRQLSQIDRDDSFEMTVQRNGQFVAITIGLLK